MVEAADRLYADRTIGGHCHYWGADRLTVAGGAEGPGSRQPNPMRQQPEADWPGLPQFP